MVRIATIKIISNIRIKLASKIGHPFNSELLNLLIFTKFLLNKNITHDIKTRIMKNSIIDIKTL